MLLGRLEQDLHKAKEYEEAKALNTSLGIMTPISNLEYTHFKQFDVVPCAHVESSSLKNHFSNHNNRHILFTNIITPKRKNNQLIITALTKK